VQRLGLLGGTFDPVHNGHLLLGRAARDQLELDQVLFVVAGDPWQKSGHVVASAEDRYALVAAALAGEADLEPSRIEVDRAGPTYTIDTVLALQAPDRELLLIAGDDVVARLDSWHRADELRDLVTIAVVDRADGQTTSVAPGWRCVTVTMAPTPVSSTDIRRRIAAGEPIHDLVPPAVERLLRERNLYTAADAP
jgi:nicotinate-nucleotide adenylyltransferase